MAIWPKESSNYHTAIMVSSRSYVSQITASSLRRHKLCFDLVRPESPDSARHAGWQRWLIRAFST